MSATLSNEAVSLSRENIEHPSLQTSLTERQQQLFVILLFFHYLLSTQGTVLVFPPCKGMSGRDFFSSPLLPLFFLFFFFPFFWFTAKACLDAIYSHWGHPTTLTGEYDPWSIPADFTVYKSAPEWLRPLMHPHWQTQKAVHPFWNYFCGLYLLVGGILFIEILNYS